MQPHALNHRSLWSPASLTGTDLSALLDTALSLKQAAAAGRPLQPLRGKNIAVMGPATAGAATLGFTRAAQALGAQVAHLQPGDERSTTSPDTARVLGQLYDAIECEGLPLATVQELERNTGRPVFSSLDQATLTVRMLGDLMDLREAVPVGAHPENHHYAIQALLCSAMA